MIDVTVKVPEERIAEFYGMYGRWLSGEAVAEAEEQPAVPVELVMWSDTQDDEALAKVVWGKLSQRAKDMFTLLMDNPDKKFGGEALAEQLDIPNGKYGVAGVLAWPGRHSYAVNRYLPIRYEEGQDGELGSYWMTSEVAALFGKVRNR